MATGWLGWPPDVAWRTPIPELLIAMDARVEWANLTNPFGGGGKPKAKARQSAAEMRKALRGR